MAAWARIRVAGLPLAVLALAGCLMEPLPDCDYTTCGTQDGRVTAVGRDGSVRWSATLRDSAESSRGAPTAAPVVHPRGRYVVVDGCRAVHVLDTATGAVVLETESVGRVWAVTDDLVVGSARDPLAGGAWSEDRGLVAVPLAGADGSWVRLPTREQVVQGVVEVDAGLAVLAGDLVHVLRRGGPTTLVTLDQAVSAPPSPAPALVGVDDHTVAVLHDDGTVEAVDTGRGRSVWKVEPSTPARTARVVRLGDDLLLSWGTTTDGEVARVAADGAVGWRAEGALPPVLLDPGAAVVPVRTQSLTAVDAATGERLPLVASPRPANDVPVLSGTDVVAWTAAGIGTTSAWSPAKPAGEPVWRHQGVLVGRAFDGVVLLTGRSAVRSLTAVGVAGAELWQLPTRHEGLTVTPAPAVGTIVSDLAVEVVRSNDCDDYPTRHTVPAASLE